MVTNNFYPHKAFIEPIIPNTIQSIANLVNWNENIIKVKDNKGDKI